MAAAWQRKIRSEFSVVLQTVSGELETMKVFALDEKGARRVAETAKETTFGLIGASIVTVFAVVL